MAALIGFLIFEGFQLLDASGPIAAFEIAGRYRPGAYALTTLAKAAGSVASSTGVSMNAIGCGSAPALDTLVVAGGDGARQALRDPEILGFVRAAAPKARRVTSVCSGAFILAEAAMSARILRPPLSRRDGSDPGPAIERLRVECAREGRGVGGHDRQALRRVVRG